MHKQQKKERIQVTAERGYKQELPCQIMQRQHIYKIF